MTALLPAASLTTAKAAARLGMTESYIRRLCRTGKLTCERVGARSWLISAESVAAYAAAIQARSASE